MDVWIRRALEEDRAFSDVTANACVAEDCRGRARLYAKADGVLSGLALAVRCFVLRDGALRVHCHLRDGDRVRAGDEVLYVEGALRSVLAAERTALNILQHLSGIASATRRMVDLVQAHGCRIADTRKTTPGMRLLEKQAVMHGGGVNHRMDLADAVLIKENHIAACGCITDAVRACRRYAGACSVEVECETLAQVNEAVEAGVDAILLDNMDVPMVRRARRLVPAHILLEASGNITLETAAEYAATGVDRLAVGAITHSAPALDLSLRIEADA